MIRRPPRSTQSRSSAASDVYKRQDYLGPEGVIRLTDQPPQNVAGLGIARTFQNIELFEHATVLQNLLIGRHTQRKTGLWQDLFFTKTAREAELKAREKAEEVIDFLDLQH